MPVSAVKLSAISVTANCRLAAAATTGASSRAPSGGRDKGKGRRGYKKRAAGDGDGHGDLRLICF
jgi:hypothetical protein